MLNNVFDKLIIIVQTEEIEDHLPFLDMVLVGIDDCPKIIKITNK